MRPLDVDSLFDRRADRRWERTCVGDMLERVTWSRPDEVALVAAPGASTAPTRARLTYRQADRLVNRVANGLLERGLRRGDRVLLGCENSVEAYLVLLGVAKAGLVAVPLNPNMATDVVQHATRLAEPRLSVVDSDLWPRFADAFAAEGLSADVALAFSADLPSGSQWFDDFLAEVHGPEGGTADSEPDVDVHGDDIWQMLFTSGTTAMPKASMVSHTHSYMAAYSYALSLTRGLVRESDLRLCTFLPIVYHVAGSAFTFPAFLSGGRLVIGRRHDPELIARTVTREAVTALWGGAPIMLRGFADALAADPVGTTARSIQVIAHGWGSLPPGLAARLRSLCSPSLRLFTIFGQTEAVSSARFWAHRDSETYIANAPARNYVGRPNPLLAERIVDSDGEPVTEPEVVGEAVLRSPVVTAGYYRNREATEEAFRGGWFHSGDSCVYDSNGLLIMVDRLKDIVKSGGENVSSQRVEAVLLEHPSVERAAVVGLPHERWGEAVTAVVVLAAGAELDEAALLTHCRRTLAGYEMPKQFLAVEDLPQTVGGKILKYRLRERFADHYRTTDN